MKRGFGLLANSPAVVIGAMLVAMLIGKMRFAALNIIVVLQQGTRNLNVIMKTWSL